MLSLSLLVAAYYIPGSDPRAGHPEGSLENVLDSLVMLQNICFGMYSYALLSMGSFFTPVILFFVVLGPRHL